MSRNILTTLDLIDTFKDHRYKYLEVSLILKSGFIATHFMSFRKSFIWDYGIDDQITKWQPKQLLEHYNIASWMIKE